MAHWRFAVLASAVLVSGPAAAVDVSEPESSALRFNCGSFAESQAASVIRAPCVGAPYTGEEEKQEGKTMMEGGGAGFGLSSTPPQTLERIIAENPLSGRMAKPIAPPLVTAARSRLFRSGSRAMFLIGVATFADGWWREHFKPPEESIQLQSAEGRLFKDAMEQAKAMNRERMQAQEPSAE